MASPSRIDEKFLAAERELSAMIKALSPQDAVNYRLSAAAINGVVERYGGAAILAIWMSAAAYSREAAYASQSESGAATGAGDQADP